MSSTAIDFPSNRSQLDPSLNSPPFDDVPLLDGDIFVAAGSSYTWTLDTGETYGRWRNEDPGATGDGRYVKLEDAGKTQVINGGGVLSINDKVKLDGGDGSASFAGGDVSIDTASTFNGIRVKSPDNTGDAFVTLSIDGEPEYFMATRYDMSSLAGTGWGIRYGGRNLLGIDSNNSLKLGGATNADGPILDTSSPNIALNGADGSAEFKNAVTVDVAEAWTPAVNIKINGSDDNSIYIDGGGTVSAVNFNARPVGASAHTISLNGETGSATFAGRINAPEFYSGSVDNFYLTSNYQQGGIGSADGAGIFRLRDPDSTHGLQQAIRITQGGNQPNDATISLLYDGSATFAGNVTANGTILTRSTGDINVGDRLEQAQETFQKLSAAVDNATDFAQLKAAMQQALSDFGGTPTTQPAPTPTPTPTPEPTPDPTNLIPDDWTHIEKLKALKELITEMDL